MIVTRVTTGGSVERNEGRPTRLASAPPRITIGYSVAPTPTAARLTATTHGDCGSDGAESPGDALIELSAGRPTGTQSRPGRTPPWLRLRCPTTSVPSFSPDLSRTFTRGLPSPRPTSDTPVNAATYRLTDRAMTTAEIPQLHNYRQSGSDLVENTRAPVQTLEPMIFEKVSRPHRRTHPPGHEACEMKVLMVSQTPPKAAIGTAHVNQIPLGKH
jgi:hypothetical protein